MQGGREKWGIMRLGKDRGTEGEKEERKRYKERSERWMEEGRRR